MNVTPAIYMHGASDRIRNAIADASRRTGTDFNYLYKQAEIESGLNTTARARTSSAAGLYQFIDQSWLAALKQHGGKHGYGWAANCITRGAGGRWCVPDDAARDAIFRLREQPEASALMAAETAADNRTTIERTTGRAATATDLYLGHFLGAQGAVDFLGAMQRDAGQRADMVMPAAARSNRGVFYAADGSPRSLAQVYDRFAAKLGAAGSLSAPARGDGEGAVDIDALLASFDAPSDDGDDSSGALGALPPFLARALSGLPTPETTMRVRPETARLAYLSLAKLGGDLA